MNLFDFTPYHEPHIGPRGKARRNDGPRQPLPDEMRAYLDWIAERDGVHVPPGVEYHLAGIWSRAEARYIVAMPGYGQAQVATCEVLDDAGNVVRTMTLPQDKRGGIPATAKQVRDWCGLEPVKAKPGKAGTPTTDALPDPSPFATFLEYVRSVAGTKRWFVGRWSASTRERYEFKFTPAEYRALQERFEASHPVTALEAVTQDSAPTMDEAPVQDGQDAQEGLAPTCGALQPVCAPEPAPVPETAVIEPVSNPDKLPASIDLDDIAARLAALEHALATLRADTEGRIVGAADKHRRSNPGSLRSRPATAPRETDACHIEALNSTPTADAAPAPARAQRTPAHERAIRRAWAERAARRKQAALAVDMKAELIAARAKQDAIKAAMDSRMRHLSAQLDATRTNMEKWASEARKGRKGRTRRLATAQRARRMIAAERAQADLKSRALDVANAALAKLRQDMADPSQPERASDLARLVQERDQARTALAAVTARSDRYRGALVQLAGQFDAMVSRVTRAEAAMRKLGIAA